MSGDRQHFLPRLLLRGFASRVRNETTYTWVFRTAASFETNIVNVGVSKEFYNLADNTALDDLITEMESRFGNCITELKSRTDETEIHDPAIQDLIANLLFRTKHFRDNFYGTANYMINAVLTQLDRPEMVERILLNEIKTNPDKFLGKIFEGRPLSKKQRKLLVSSIRNLVPSLVKTRFPEIALMVNMFRDHMRDKLPRIVKESHVKSLTNNPSPKAWVDFVGGLKWFLLIRGAGSFILGDVAVVSVTGSDRRLKSLPDLIDDVVQLALPISHTHLVVGVKDGRRMNTDVEYINMATASLSRDFFVSSKNSEREQIYASALGTHADLLTDKELQQIVAEGSKGLLG
jgi:hypothetical protein